MSRKRSATAAALTAPTSKTESAVAIVEDKKCSVFEQIYGTLRLCLRYGPDHINVFKKLIERLETMDLPSILKRLSADELQRFMPMLAGRLNRIQLDLADIKHMHKFCLDAGISELPLVNHCVVHGNLQMPKGTEVNKAMHQVGELLPGLQTLHVTATLVDSFPRNLSQLATLVIYKNITQPVLDQLCKNCPNLQRLQVRNDSTPVIPIDCFHLRKCCDMRQLQLPLMLRSTAFLGHLKNLQYLSLHRRQPWPETEWLAIVKKIIKVKKFELRTLRFDGTWLSSPFDFSLLDLRFCTCLKDLLLSNSKLTERTRQAVLPLSCQSFLLQGCTVGNLFRYLEDAKLLSVLELIDCPLTVSGEMLLQLLKQRKSQGSLEPLNVKFSHMPPLSSELSSWGPNRRKSYAEWMQVEESFENEPSWRNSPGAVTMTFGTPVNYVPQIFSSEDQSDITPSELLKQLGWT